MKVVSVTPTGGTIDRELTAAEETLALEDQAKQETVVNATKYAFDRQMEYPDLAEQLDYIYHNGIAKWKSDMIKPVKDKYPKG